MIKAKLPRKLIGCDLCGYQVTSKFELSRHMRATHAFLRSECLFCNKVFDNPERLKGHHLRAHKDIQSFQCKLCKADYSLYEELHDHVKNDHRTKMMSITLACDLCDMKCFSKVTIANHMKVFHSGEFRCFDMKCSKRFQSASMRKQHLFYHHGRDREEIDRLDTIETEASLEYQFNFMVR